MNKHSIYYYPYASFRDDQVPLLKAVALYFDKLYILDPLKACWDMIGPERGMHELTLLEQEGILERVAPEEVLKEYEKAITAEILADMTDPKFLSLCKRKGRGRSWTLALAKVPKEIRKKYRSLDMPMRRLMRDVPKKVASELEDYEDGGGYGEGEYSESAAREIARLSDAYDEVRELDMYDEYRETYAEVKEYRFADYPLHLGESIMVNHALFGGFLHTGAVPLTDDRFHNKVLNLKIKRAGYIPEIRNILEDRAKQRQLKRSQLAMTTLTDLDLAIISPEMPMAEILKYRDDNADTLGQAREELALLAREVQHQPWTEDFADELETKAIPKVQRMLKEGKKARNSWLKSKRGRMILKAAGIALGTAGATVSLAACLTPLLPIGVTTGALSLASGAAIPTIELMMDWRVGKRGIEENGLHYLINLKKR